jgi:hypothetical protein
MKTGSQIEKWVAGFLGVVCLALILNMVFRSGARAGGTRPPARSVPDAPRTRVGSAPARSSDELARYDPRVRLDLLKEIQDRPLPKLARNPWEFEARAAPAPQAKGEAPVAPAPPPKPPPPPLKAVGVTQKSGGVNEAIVSDDQEIYIVHEGETFARRFRVVKITPSQVEVDDDTTHETIRLPIAP